MFIAGYFTFNGDISTKLVRFINGISSRKQYALNQSFLRKHQKVLKRIAWKATVEDGYVPIHELSNMEFSVEDRLHMHSEKDSLPAGMPNPYCHWIIDSKDRLVWDGHEEFSDCMEWLQYLINRFFQPDGLSISGEVICYGNEIMNGSFIIADHNILTTVPFQLCQKDDHWSIK